MVRLRRFKMSDQMLAYIVYLLCGIALGILISSFVLILGANYVILFPLFLIICGVLLLFVMIKLARL